MYERIFEFEITNYIFGFRRSEGGVSIYYNRQKTHEGMYKNIEKDR